MGELTRGTIDANTNPNSASMLSLVHDWFVISTLVVYTAVAMLSLAPAGD